jgi:HK97 family phage major capsid protein
MTTEEVVKALEEKITEKGFATKTEVSELLAKMEEIKGMTDQSEVKNALVNLEAEVKAMKENKQEDEPKGFFASLKKGLQENIEKLRALAADDLGTAKSNEFSFKAAADMLISNNVSGGNVPVEQRLPGLNVVPTRRVRLLDLVSRGVANSNVISWVYQANKDGSAGYTAEGDDKNQIDFDLVVANENVKKYTAFIKVSTEMLADIDFIESAIRTELSGELLRSVESAVYAGGGGGTALNGIYTVATAFSAGSFAATVDNANEVDVLTVAVNQIILAEHDTPNAIMMHPSDVTKLKMVKVSSSDKRYVERLAMVAGELSLDGVPIIPTTLVAVGTFLVGDFAKALVLDKGTINIQVGLDGNDFTKNMRTILAEWRGVCIVKNNDRTAFVKGTFSSAKAAIETT